MRFSRREILRLGGMLLLSGSVPGKASGGDREVPVLMYHDLSHSYSDEYTVSPSLFAAQMEWLYNNGFRAVSLRDVPRLSNDEKAVVLTFDDGYASYMDYAFPLFREYGFRSLINVIGFHAGGFLPFGGNRPMLSWDEYRHLLGSGLVDIGCHTHDLHTFSHRGALGVSAQRMEEDLNTFSGTLWRETGTSTDILSWPYGLYDGKSISVAKKAGFRYFLTSKDEPFAVTGSLEEIPRRTVNKHHDLVSFRGVVEGRQ